jgi:hypothetical protein
MAAAVREQRELSHYGSGRRRLTTHQRIMMGGLGALTPIVLSLLTVDLKTTFTNITFFVIAGYAIRVIVLFYMGGIVAFLHKDENKPLKLFELGIVAPALLMTMISAAQIETPKAEKAVDQSRAGAFLFMPVAYAQENYTQSNVEKRLKRFTLPKEGVTSQVWRGLTGSKIENVWFVIVDSFPKLEVAEREAERINQWQGEFKAEVFAPYDDSQGYSVVIGANLTSEEANSLKKKAANIGVKSNLWTFPNR